jgi:ribose transport system permease protein
MSTATTARPSSSPSNPRPGTDRQTRSGADVVRRVLARPGASVVGLLIIICVIMAVRSSSFMTVSNWQNIVTQMVYVTLLAIGMTFVLIVGGIDLSVGSVLGLCAGLMATLINDRWIFIQAVIVTLALGAAIGLFNGLVITKLGIPDFVATLATLGICSGLLFLWTGGVPFLGYMYSTYNTVGGVTKLFSWITFPLVAAITIALLASFVLRFTAFGRHLYGVGSNRDAARLSGINVDRTKISAYVISGTLAAGTGILLAGQTTTVPPTMGAGYEINAIAAAVIGGAALSGGRGRVFGAVLGALTLTVANNVINLANISATWQQVVVGAILLLAVALDRGSVYLNRRLGRASMSV